MAKKATPIRPAWAKFHSFSTFSVKAKATVSSTKYDDIAMPVQRIWSRMAGSIIAPHHPRAGPRRPDPNMPRDTSGNRFQQRELLVLHHIEIDRLLYLVVVGNHQLAGHRQIECLDRQQCLAAIL